jgi:hypothetical protein
MYEVLAAYRRLHGHCRVPYAERSRLSRWVGTQRQAKHNGKLGAEQIRRLDKLGFSWNGTPPQARWDSMYEALVAYQRAHGHCRVPNAERSRLSRWVQIQRLFKHKGRLSKDRVRRLDKLGFDWHLQEDRWERMFTALVKYKNVHGDCDVPSEWPEDRELGCWVSTQRWRGRKGSLRPERMKRLEAIGFRWWSKRERRLAAV